MKMQVSTTTMLVLSPFAVLLLSPLAGAEASPAQPSPGGLRKAAPAQEPPRPTLQWALDHTLSLKELLDYSARSIRLESNLEGVFASLPKSENGTVGSAATRYALHRLFLQLHGWQLQGLDASGGNWSSASPIAAFGDRVSQTAKGIMEEHLSTRGLTLEDLAFLAAMLEHMVHGQIEGQLKSIFEMLRRPLRSTLDKSSALDVIDTYMASYILGANTSAMTPLMLHEFNMTIEEQHPTWPETKLFLREVQQELFPTASTFFFSDVVAVVEEAADRFGLWQSKECLALKQELVTLEDFNGSGRVRLADFYGGAVHGGKWQFSETLDYLRGIGAVDDTDASGPRVIIPNYIYSPSNCLASSSFYAVCCIDECDELLSHLENSLGQPTATPEDIVDLVSGLHSTSNNGTLPAGLVKRLHEVAEHHGGQVPLHGRLLAQWLHHAFPRECPYPHVSGTTAPKRPQDWEFTAGLGSTTATDEEMAQHIWGAQGEDSKALLEQQSGRQPEQQPEQQRPQQQARSCEEGLCSPMWTMEEELLDAHAHEVVRSATAAAGRATAARTAARGAAVLVAGGSLVWALVRMLRLACSAEGPHGSKGLKLPRYSC